MLSSLRCDWLRLVRDAGCEVAGVTIGPFVPAMGSSCGATAVRAQAPGIRPTDQRRGTQQVTPRVRPRPGTRTANTLAQLSHPLNRVAYMSSAAQDRHGRAGREAASVVDSVVSLVDRFDPDLTAARDALDLVSESCRLEHLASAGVALAARRVAQTDLWRRGGHRSAAHWLAHVAGMGVWATRCGCCRRRRRSRPRPTPATR